MSRRLRLNGPLTMIPVFVARFSLRRFRIITVNKDGGILRQNAGDVVLPTVCLMVLQALGLVKLFVMHDRCVVNWLNIVLLTATFVVVTS